MLTMNMRTQLDNRQIQCTVFPAENSYVSVVHVPCDLAAETIPYAACRLFAHSQALQDAFVPLSYRLRFAGGKHKKQHIFAYTVQVPAKFFALSKNVSAYIDIIVTPVGVQVNRVRLLPAKVYAAPGGKRILYKAS